LKTSSAKAKGRRCQDLVRDALRSLGITRGLVAEDIESRGMGQNGVDVILSPAAMRVFPLDVECKNVESLNVTTTFWKHFNGYKDRVTSKILVHMKNHHKPLVTLLFSEYVILLEQSLKLKEMETKN
jgi:hypothetical protein